MRGQYLKEAEADDRRQVDGWTCHQKTEEDDVHLPFLLADLRLSAEAEADDGHHSISLSVH